MRTTRTSRGTVGVMVALTLALVLAACGTDDANELPEPNDATEVPAETATATESPEESTEADASAACADSGELTEIVYPMLTGGAGLIPAHYISTSGLDEEFGLKLVLRNYDNLATYYSDGAQGILDVVHGSADAFASQASSGVPIHLVATMTPWHGWLVAGDEFDFEDPTSLEGSRISTIGPSGTFQTFRGALNEWYDIDVEAIAEIVGASNPAAAMAQVSAGTADVGLSWEPSVTAAMLQDESLEVIYDLGAEFEERYGLPMWHFVMVMQNESDLPEGTEDCFVAMFQRAAQDLHDDPEQSDRIAQEVGFEPGVVKEALTSGRLVYDIRAVDQDIRESIEQGLSFLPEDRIEGEVPDSFWSSVD